MKLSFLIGTGVGYVLGSRAGRERYEAIVAVARRVAGSQTVQTTAGVLQAQVDTVAQRARTTLAAKLHGGSSGSSPHSVGVNGSNGSLR